MLGQDRALAAHHRLGPERRGLGVDNAHGVRVDLLDLDVLVSRHRHGGGGRVAAVLPGEDHVVRGERLAVVPSHAALELPCHAGAVGRDAAVLARRNFGGQRRNQVAFTVPSGEWFVEDARRVLFLGTAGEVRVQVHRSLPPDQLERSAAAAFGGFVGNRRRSLRHAFVHQQHRGHRRGEAHAHHALDEASSRDLALAHVLNQVANLTLFHGASPCSPRLGPARPEGSVGSSAASRMPVAQVAGW